MSAVLSTAHTMAATRDPNKPISAMIATKAGVSDVLMPALVVTPPGALTADKPMADRNISVNRTPNSVALRVRRSSRAVPMVAAR